MNDINNNHINNEQIINNKRDFDKLKQKYKLLIRLGKGSFGSVYHIMHKETGNEQAVKIEEKSSRSQLKNEYKIYKNLIRNGVSGIPNIVDYFESKKLCFMIMQLLGDSLDHKFNNYGKFDLSTVLKLGIKIIGLLENIHDAGYLHRDIKPNNFLVGTGHDYNKIYVMDFGLSKKYITNDGEHIKFRDGRSLVGTARYASINVHMGFEPSRRDDLESVGYMLIYFLKKKLPWQGLKKKKNIDQVKLIGDVKMKTSLNYLCYDLPQCFGKYLVYCKNLKFEEKPNYKYLMNLFIHAAMELNIPCQYCWEK
jgi:serine/threonine protein kinase